MNFKTITGRGPIAAAAAVLFLAVLGSLAVAYAADPYPWGFSDSVAYIVSARNLLRGDGLGMWTASGRFAPLTLHPPFYPLILAGAGALGVNLLAAARGLDILLFGAVILLSCFIAWEATRSAAVSIATGLLIVTSPRLLDPFSSAMSEPAFIFLSLLSLGLAIAATRSRGPIFIVASALAASLATLTRFAGFGLLPAGALIVAVLSPGTPRSRLGRGGLFLLAAAIPLVGWAILQRLTHGDVLPRTFQLDTRGVWERLGPFRVDLAVSSWGLIPAADGFPAAAYRTRLVAIGAIVATPFVVGSYVVARVRGWRDDPRWAGPVRLTVAAATFLMAHLGGLAIAFLLVDPRPDINERMLLPLQIPIWLALIGAILLVAQSAGSRGWGIAGIVLASVALAFSQAPRGWSTVQDLRAHERGYLTPGWRDSEMIAVLRNLPASTGIVTNESAIVLLWADRPAYDLPEVLPEAAPRSVFRRYGDEPGDPLEARFREEDIVLALFDSIHGQLDPIYFDRARERWAAMVEGLAVVYGSSEGTIYTYPR